MLVVHLHPGGNATPVVHHANGVVGVNGDQNIVTMAGQRFIDGVVHHLENQMMQPGAIRGVANVHARAFAHRFETFQDLDGAFAICF